MTRFEHEILEGYEIYRFFYSHEIVAVTVTADNSVVRDWIKEIESATKHLHLLVVGLMGLEAALPDVVQLCVADRVLIYQLSQAAEVSRHLWLFLQNRYSFFAGDYVLPYRRILRNAGLFMGGAQHTSIRHFLGPDHHPELVDAPLHTIATSCCGASFSPDVLAKLATIPDLETSDWAADPLSKDQVEAAALCVHVLYTIGLKFHTRQSHIFFQGLKSFLRPSTSLKMPQSSPCHCCLKLLLHYHYKKLGFGLAAVAGSAQSLQSNESHPSKSSNGP